uniref:Uncharacterized protein n=1 Tax=Anopheles dirus TaxID=7168 RepID=A0A182NWE7_9DIPT
MVHIMSSSLRVSGYGRTTIVQPITTSRNITCRIWS